jgi:predicted negative regulator of RcsB-dependent stress response
LWDYHLYGDKAYEEVKRTVDTTMQQARRMSALRAIALCQCFNGALEFQAGHWLQAEAALRESIQLYRQIGAAGGEALACQRLSVLQTARGQLEDAMTTLEEGLVADERALLRSHSLTRLYTSLTRNRLAAGDLPAAEHALSQGLAKSERHGHCSTCDSLLLPAAVSVRVAQNNLAAASGFCHQLDEAAARYGSHTWVAMGHQARGELAAACGDLEEALISYTQAVDDYQHSDYAYQAARCLAADAELLNRRHNPGDAEHAHTVQSEAQRLFQELGITEPIAQ